MRSLILAFFSSCIIPISARTCVPETFTKETGHKCDMLEYCEVCTTSFSYSVDIEYERIPFKKQSVSQTTITKSDQFQKQYNELDKSFRNAMANSGSSRNRNSGGVSGSNASSSSRHSKRAKSAHFRASARYGLFSGSVSGGGSSSSENSQSNSQSSSHSKFWDNSNSKSFSSASDFGETFRAVKAAESKVGKFNQHSSATTNEYQDGAIVVFRVIKMETCIDNVCKVVNNRKLMDTEWESNQKDYREWDRRAVRYINSRLLPDIVPPLDDDAAPHIKFSTDIVEQIEYEGRLTDPAGRCYVDSGDDRDLANEYSIPEGTDFSIQWCRFHCLSKGFIYAGIQAKDWCMCGNDYGKHGFAYNQDECNIPCPGKDSDQKCGGAWRNNIYLAEKPDPAGKCYVDANDRDLPYYVEYKYNLNELEASLNWCINHCYSERFKYAGLQGFGCFCGNDYGKYGLAENQGDCNFAKHFVESGFGGGWRNNIYLAKKIVNKPEDPEGKCYVDANDRDLPYEITIERDWTQRKWGASERINWCSNHCYSKGFKYAGIQVADQCFCGDDYGKHGLAENQDDCTIFWKDNMKGVGGNWRNSMYLAKKI